MGKECKNDRGRYALTAKEIAHIAAAVALFAVCSWISIPFGSVPITLQTLALFLMVGVLGTRRATFAVFAYLALGFFGVPVFSLFTGGVGKLFEPAGGFLIGFLVATPIMGLFYRGKLWQKAVALGVGVIVYNAIGAAWFCGLYTGFSLSGVWAATLTCVLPYLAFDFIKMAIAIFLAEKLKGKI